MSTIKQVAQAFAAGKAARCRNAHTDGVTYTLHRSVIARREGAVVVGDWCGYYTPTTLNHLKHIADALGAWSPCGYATARNTNAGKFEFKPR